MGQARKIDRNQVEIVAALRKVGASVQHLHMVGRGCPDLLVGFRGQNFCFEIKDGNLPPSQRRLNLKEMEWHKKWQGSVQVVNSIDDALGVIGLVKT